MKLRRGWSSHIPMLVKMLQNSSGPVLELGMGLFSTPVLHWMCQDLDRKLVSYENEEKYFKIDLDYQNPNHEVKLVENWDDAEIDNTHWGMILVDHAPASRRKVDIRRLANKADFLIVHDTQPEDERFYKYHWVFPEFKYRYDYTKASPNTTILSNFIDLSFLNK